MRVFVLCTGRTGSVTFSKASAHATNFTAGHETRSNLYGDARLDFPDQHIEVDNRLIWYAGRMAERFPDAKYVHLQRDEVQVARSYAKRYRSHPPDRTLSRTDVRARFKRRMAMRYPHGLMPSWAYSIVQRFDPLGPEEQHAAALDMVRTINANIRLFLQERDSIEVHLEDIDEDFPEFWRWAGLEGDLDAALAEWGTRHNAS